MLTLVFTAFLEVATGLVPLTTLSSFESADDFLLVRGLMGRFGLALSKHAITTILEPG